MYRPPEIQCIYCGEWMELEEDGYSPCECERGRSRRHELTDYELQFVDEEAA